MRNTLVHLFVVAAALAATAWLLPGVRIDSMPALLVGSLVLAMVNAWVRPLILLLTLPLTVVTLGLFIFAINGLVFGLAAWLVPGFSVAGFGWAVVGSVVVSLISLFLSMLLKDDADGGDHKTKRPRR